MQLSFYQEQIIEWVKSGTGHGCCNAVAGSGKSTTLRLAAKALEESGVKPSEIKICVFGKANTQDLITKFGKAWESSISTLHSAGWSLIKRHLDIKNPQGLIKSVKYKAIAQDLDLIQKRGSSWLGSLRRENVIAKDEEFMQLCDLVRLTNSSPNGEVIREICNHFEITEIYNYSSVAHAIAIVLNKGEMEAKRGDRFDFTDQIWLPVKWGLKPSYPYKFVLVDECQDLNAVQMELVLSLAGSNGRILAVGDPRQAIMGFAGADNRSYHKIVERLQAKELPLSICYRCPSTVISLVKQNFPEIPIECSPSAAEGKIEAITERDLWDTEFDGFTNAPKNSNLREGDMVISRKTAPLVSLCIKLIARGIAATVKGKAIGDQVKGDLEEIAKMPGFRYENFNNAVNAYSLDKRQRYQGLDNEEQLTEQLNDKLEALTTIYKSQPQASCIQHLADYIDNLFSDEHSPITLSTCHRAKGLEGDRIFIIKPEDMPMTWRNQQDWQFEQEQNLLYVALTRTKSELFIVGEPDWLLPKPEQQQSSTVNPLQLTLDLDPVLVVNTPPELSPSERVREFLLNPENQLLSDRAIAAQLGCSAPTVAKVRRRLRESGFIGDETNGKRLTKHGYIIHTDNIGTKPRTAKERLTEIVEGLNRSEILELIEFLTEKL